MLDKDSEEPTLGLEDIEREDNNDMTTSPTITTKRPHFRTVLYKNRNAVSFFVHLPKEIPLDHINIEATATKLTLSTKEPFNGVLYKMEADIPNTYILLDPGNPTTSWKKTKHYFFVIRFNIQLTSTPSSEQSNTKKEKRKRPTTDSEKKSEAPKKKKRKKTTPVATEQEKIAKEEEKNEAPKKKKRRKKKYSSN